MFCCFFHSYGVACRVSDIFGEINAKRSRSDLLLTYIELLLTDIHLGDIIYSPAVNYAKTNSGEVGIEDIGPVAWGVHQPLVG